MERTLSTLPLAGGYIGIERETLRTNPDASLATTPHPSALGSVLTHPNLTIDYAESLLELVTNAHQSAQATYQELYALHQYTAQHIGNERLWPASMPCVLPEESTIEIGQFGQSNSGKIRQLYRVGLGHRYGKAMQMIAGIHFNYSPPDALFDALAEHDGQENTQAYRNQRYMGMLRSLQRHSWLICYLFGASPAVDESFAPAQQVLNPMAKRTLGWQQATSLRMSKLGYQNKVDFTVSFNKLDDYLRDLATAVLTPTPAFEYLGLYDEKGQRQQISANLLQIANEYYTAARPKQGQKPGELPIVALNSRGIAYIELRITDINPFEPCGISLAQMQFLEVFMLWALLYPEADFTHTDYNDIHHNRLRTACCGLGDIELAHQGKMRQIASLARQLLAEMQPIAHVLGAEHSTAITTLDTQIQDKQLLAHQVHAQIRQSSHIDWAMALSDVHLPALHAPLDAQLKQQLDQLRDKSLQAFAEIESAAVNQMPFETFLNAYFNPLKALYNKRYDDAP